MGTTFQWDEREECQGQMIAIMELIGLTQDNEEDAQTVRSQAQANKIDQLGSRVSPKPTCPS